ncbi:MAG TPA: LamB/YcsF family protein, partial [Chloroflexota bacterium]
RIVEQGSVVAHDGTSVPVHAQSICFHGDTPGAPRIVAAARERLAAAGVAVCPIPALLGRPVA